MIPSTTEHPGWVEICINADSALHESINNFLFDLGCTGLVTEDLEGHTLKAYMPLQEDLEDIQNRVNAFLHDLREIFHDFKSPHVTFNKIEDQDWNQNWRQFFRPDRITPELLVLPAWEAVPSSIDGHIIRLDPGPAFGTGQHPSTRMCLEAMEKIALPESWTMLDVGTGSGILAIYGAKLGANNVKAIDIDPEAIRWATRNVELNVLTETIRPSSSPIEKVSGPFSLVAANLIFDEIMTLFPQFERVVSPRGWLILSGILREQVQKINKVLGTYRFAEYDALYKEEWACMICRKSHEE